MGVLSSWLPFAQLTGAPTHFHSLKSPGKNTNMSSSERLPLKKHEGINKFSSAHGSSKDAEPILRVNSDLERARMCSEASALPPAPTWRLGILIACSKLEAKSCLESPLGKWVMTPVCWGISSFCEGHGDSRHTFWRFHEKDSRLKGRHGHTKERQALPWMNPPSRLGC